MMISSVPDMIHDCTGAIERRSLEAAATASASASASASGAATRVVVLTKTLIPRQWREWFVVCLHALESDLIPSCN